MTQPPETPDPNQPTPPYQPYGAPQPGPRHQAGPYQAGPYQAGPFQGPPVNPYPTPPSGGGGAGKIIAIVVGVIVLVALLVCGGIVAVSVWFVKEVDSAFDEFDPRREGGSRNPITVEIGEAFEIDGIEYAEGWTLQEPADEYRGHTIVGLKGTNDREDKDPESVYLYFTFVDEDAVEVGEITCSSNGSISYGNAENLTCRSRQAIAGPYERIDVNAS